MAVSSSSLEPRVASVGDGTVSYLEAGQGPALVLLHGIGSGAQSWRHQLTALSDGFRVVAWDAPGYGRSTALAAPEPDAGDYAAALAAFLTAVGIERCHLLGHSLGSLIAARFAAEHPERILSLTLASIANGHARLPAEERERLKQGRLGDLAALGPRAMAEKRGPRLLSAQATEAMRRAVIDTMAAVRPDGYAQAVGMLSRGDAPADIARLAPGMAVQVIFGDADVITPPEANREAAAMRPQAPVHVIAGAGHAVYLEKPDAFNALLRRFAAA